MWPTLHHCKKHKSAGRKHLTAWAVSTNQPPPGTQMGNSCPTYPPFPFSKGFTLSFLKKRYPLILATGLWSHWSWRFMGNTALFYITICPSAHYEWTGHCDWWPCCQIRIFKCWTQRHHLELILTLCQKVFLPPGWWQQFCLMPMTRVLFLRNTYLNIVWSHSSKDCCLELVSETPCQPEGEKTHKQL